MKKCGMSKLLQLPILLLKLRSNKKFGTNGRNTNQIWTKTNLILMKTWMTITQIFKPISKDKCRINFCTLKSFSNKTKIMLTKIRKKKLQSQTFALHMPIKNWLICLDREVYILQREKYKRLRNLRIELKRLSKKNGMNL